MLLANLVATNQVSRRLCIVRTLICVVQKPTKIASPAYLHPYLRTALAAAPFFSEPVPCSAFKFGYAAALAQPYITDTDRPRGHFLSRCR